MVVIEDVTSEEEARAAAAEAERSKKERGQLEQRGEDEGGDATVAVQPSVCSDERGVQLVTPLIPQVVPQAVSSESQNVSAVEGNGKRVPTAVDGIVRGVWSEGSWIDKLDKRISTTIFTLEFGYVTELLLLMPGTWFGLPVPAFILSNFLTWYAKLAHEVEEDMSWLASVLGVQDLDNFILRIFHTAGISSYASLEFIALTLLFITLWGVIFYRFLLRGEVEKAYLINKQLMIPSLVFPIGFSKLFSPSGFRAGSFYIVSWMAAQAVSSSMKTLFARTRPTASPPTNELIESVYRAFPTYRQMLSIGESVFESFPSGDTVGAACFSSVLFILQAPTWTIWISVLTAFCRMYFHAHHLLDVFAGLVIGWTVTLALNVVFGIEYFDASHTAIAFVLFIVFMIQLQKFKPELPDHMKVKGRKGF